MLIAVGVIAISAGAIGMMVGLSRFDVLKGKVLNVSKAESGVQRILVDPADGYGATSVTNVVCNNGNDPEIKKGATFTCDVVVDGRKRQVLVVFQDARGSLRETEECNDAVVAACGVAAVDGDRLTGDE